MTSAPGAPYRLMRRTDVHFKTAYSPAHGSSGPGCDRRSAAARCDGARGGNGHAEDRGRWEAAPCGHRDGSWAAGCSVEGLAKNLWSPAKDGTDFELSPSLAPLEPFRDYVTIISDTDLANAEALTAAERGGDHNRSSAVFLTASHPKQTEGSDILAGPSIDQIYAQKLCQDTAVPSIQLCIENVGSISGACGYGYSCVYSNAISWTSPTMPLPMERDPRAMFESLFGQGATAAERAARRREGLSILDGVRERVRLLLRDIGAGDRTRLNQYLDGVREIERRLVNVEKGNSENVSRELPDAPIGVPDSFEEHTRLMFDLQVLAFATETTRVSAFKMGRDVSPRIYPESGVTTPFHSLSHHSDRSEKIAEFSKTQCLPCGHGHLFPREAAQHAGWRRQPPRPFDGDLRQSDG